MDQNIDSSGLDQIQTPQYSVIHPPSQEINHYVQYKEYLENSSNEIVVSNSNQKKEKPPQDSDICQLIREECCIEVCKKQKQNIENTMLELIKVCRQKAFYCMHDNVDDLIESALNSKLLLINLESQCLDKKKQGVKNVVEQPTKRETRIAKSLQNFRVVLKKSSISLKNTSQISSVHAIAPILPTEEPEYSLSMGYEHLNTILETESDEVTESSAKNLLPIPSEYEVTSDDESECDVPIKDESSPAFTTFSNPLFDDNDDFTSSDDESLPDENVPMENFKVYSNPLFDDDEINSDKLDPHCFNAESDFVESLSNRDTLIESSPKFDYLEEFSGAFMPTSIFETLPTYPIPIDDSNSLIDEIDLFLAMDDLLHPRIESDNYDSEGDIYFLEELPVDDSIPLPKNEYLILIIRMIHPVINNIDELNEDECFDPGVEINVFANVEDDDYFLFIFVIRIFLPYLIYHEVSPLLLSAGSEDTIFDPEIPSGEIKVHIEVLSVLWGNRLPIRTVRCRCLDHLDVESHIVENHIVHSFKKGVLGIDYDSMAALGMWFHRMAMMDIGYNFGSCDHRIDFSGRKRKVVEDDGFNSGAWVSTNNYVIANGGSVTGCFGDIENFLKMGKLDQVVAIVKSCSPNMLGDLTVTMKDLSGTILGTVHHKVIGEGGYGKDITLGAALILANVLVFSLKPSMHYRNITIRNVVKVFREDTVPGSGSG
uniref:Homologous recombination OB-fold protein OB-fold domain-containing protein n=1 Tax=Tanacetum cinerariifolium TaxID=118510 RepID=A0A6L2N2L5_TANCI|nr:hypothetical protein [Tanacetum cinerariifolium]